MADYSHTLIIRGEMHPSDAEDLVFERVSGEICVVKTEAHDGNMVVRIEPNNLTEQIVEGRLNYWLNDQTHLDGILVWWNRNEEWFNVR